MSSSQFLLKPSRWAVVRMAKSRVKGCDGCGRWRLRFVCLLILSCALCSLWVFCEMGRCGFLWRKEGNGVAREEKSQISLKQFNLTKCKLQSLASMFSTMGQKPLSECLDKSMSCTPWRESISQALKLACSTWNNLQNQQELMRVNTIFHDQCPVLDGNTSEELNSMPFLDGNVTDNFPPDKTLHNEIMHLQEFQHALHPKKLLKSKSMHLEGLHMLFGKIFCLALFGIVGLCKGLTLCEALWKSSNHMILEQQQHDFRPQNSKGFGRWRKNFLLLGVFIGLVVSLEIFLSMYASIISRRKENLATMCDERARMLQDQFNVSMNHVHALAILISTFHHGKHLSAIDQKTFAEYTARTSFERPLISGVAYALKVLHSQREIFEKQHGWRIKKMETEDQSAVQDDYIPEKLDPSPVRDEYAPVIFSQETVSHIVSIDMMSGKEDRENIMRARASGTGVLTSPFNLLKSNHLGVVLTFAVYSTDLPPNATPEERIEATVGYLGASFDVPSLVERLLQQLASKRTIIVNVYDTTNSSAPMGMYGPDAVGSGELHISNLDFGDPIRRHEMHCRFKQEPSLPWSAITTSLGVAVIVMLVGHIFHAAINRIEKVEDDFREMRELKVRAEAADVAKSQFLATVSHEIRTPMNGVLGMLQMLLDTNLDATQQDFAMTAQASGKALIALLNEVLDQAKIESGRIELEAVPFDVRDVLDNAISIFSDKSQAKGIELAAFVSNRVPHVLVGDPFRFRQIITNLVGNSVKFIEKGHIFVSVHLVEEMKNLHEVNDRTSKQSVELVENCGEVLYNTLSGQQVADRLKSWEKFKMLEVLAESTDTINLLVTVEDTGVGIPLDAQSHIFMPFMQADSSTSRTYGGTGIGLSISKCLVDLMGGEIGFVSKPKIGSTFSFTAMFREGQKNSEDMKRHQADKNLFDFYGMKGLVVDGRGIRAEVTKYHLQRLGVQADIVLNHKSTIYSIMDACNSRTGHVDMVLVDKEAWGEGSALIFPRHLRELQQNMMKSHARLPKLLLLATSLSPSEVDEMKSAGYVDSMIKPLRLSMMSACLRRALGMANKRCQDKGKTTGLKSLLNGKQILVVDDNAVNRKVAAGALKKYGADVTCADCGKVAIEFLRPPHKFDACFMDVQMPEMDGFEATKQIRGMEYRVNDLMKSGEASKEMYGNVAHWHIPILAMTADVFQATHEECLRSGMDGYVSKPFEEEQLYSAVAHFFENDTLDSVA